MSKELIAKIEGSSLYSSDKKELITRVIGAEIPDATKLEIEKYRIDKMVENGLVKEKPFKDIRLEKIVDDVMIILKDARFYKVLIAVLVFTAVIFNSGNFWEYMGKSLDYDNHTKRINKSGE